VQLDRHVERDPRRPGHPPVRKPRAVLVPAHAQLPVPRHRLALQGNTALAATPPRPQPEPKPVEREAVRRAPVRRRLRPEHRDRQRDHDEPQRRRDRADRRERPERDRQQQRRGEVADRAQRHATGNRERPAVDAVDAPVDLEHPPVGADDQPLSHP
jgi:hypothetical protein